MSVRCPEDFFTLRMQMRNDIQTDGRSHHPVGASLDRSAGVGINHHRTIRMGIAKGGEFVCGATQIQRTSRIQIRHQHGLFRGENFCCLAHETYTGHDQRLGRMITTKARHLQRIRDATAGFLSQILQICIDVVVRDQHRLLFFQKKTYFVLECCLFARLQVLGHLCPS